MGESTTIDSIQIDIQSNSTNAASGIDALAASLGNLKKQTISKTAISNLEQFSSVIKNFGNVYGASNALRTLANSIEKLKSVGTLSSLNKSLTGLPTSLEKLEKIDLDKVAPQVEAVANAFSPLSSMKAGGLGTMLRNLSKIEDVTNDLDETKIKNFAAQVKKVADALGPLSQKMATIKEGFRGLNTVVKQTNRSLEQTNDEVHTGLFNFANFTNVMSSVVGVIQQVAQGFANILHGAMQWDGVKYQFGNAFGDQADIYYEKITEMTDALRINKQAFMENSAMAASMLIGFGVDKSDAREMGLGYTQLAYDIWAAFNNVYETLDGADGAMAAVRSAIAGETEPIRRAGFTIVEATLAQTAANHGLSISLETATEAQKSYLRYLTLVDQAQSKGVVGTYAREMETAEGMTRTLTQQLKSLGQAFGSLFIPMIVKALPYVQAFVELLTEGVHWLASLFGIEIQDISGTWNDYSSNVDTAVGNTENITGALNDAEKAAKALKNASIGIDELNVISPSSASNGGDGSGGSGGGAGGGAGDFGDISSLWDQSIFDSVQSQVDSIKQKLSGMFDDWLPTLQVIGGALAGWGIGHLLGQLGEALQLGDAFENKVKNIKKIAGSAIIIALQFKLMDDAFSDFMGEDGTILDYLEGVLIGAASTYLLYKQWGVGGLAIGLGITAAVSLKTVIEEGGITDAESLAVALTGLGAGLAAVATGASALSKAWKTLQGTKFMGDLGAFISLAKEGGVIATLGAAFPKLSTALAGLPAAFSSASAVLATAAPWIAVAAAVVGGLTLAFVDYDFSEVGYTIGNKIGEALRNTGAWIAKVGKSIWEGLKSAFGWVKNALDIDDFWDVLAIMFVPGEWIKRIAPELEELFKKVSEEIDKKIENLKGNINEFFGGFFDGLFDGLGLDVSWAEEFAEIFDIEYLDIVEAVINPMSLGDNIMSGIKKGIDKSETLSAIREKLSKMWTDAKTWWDTKRGNLSTYTPSIGKIWENLKSSWETAKTWWSKNRGSLSTYTPSIGKIWEKLKTAWTSAKDWWNKNRSNLSYTPSIGSISSKLSSAWTTAKNWWNKSRSSLSYTPSIGSIKDKIVSAWNTAKSWWNKNVGGLSTKLNISIPKISIKWDTVSALGKEFRYPTGFKLSYAAEGGIFDQGSLVWAGERGPEIVANAAGGKTGVMNVEQMQDAVYEGVFAAITAAMSGKSEGGAQAVNVYLDGRMITSSVEKHQRERGASIMGSGVYSY